MACRLRPALTSRWAGYTITGQHILALWLRQKGASKTDAATLAVVAGGHHGKPAQCERPDISGRVPRPWWRGTRPAVVRRARRRGMRTGGLEWQGRAAVSYTHLRAHETRHDLVCRLLLEKKKKK